MPIESHARLHAFIALDDGVGLESGVSDVEQFGAAGLGLADAQIFVVHAQNELGPRMWRLGQEGETLGVPAMVRVLGNTQIRLGHAAPCVGNDPQVPDIVFLRSQEYGPVQRDGLDGGEIGERVPAHSPCTEIWNRQELRTEQGNGFGLQCGLLESDDRIGRKLLKRSLPDSHPSTVIRRTRCEQGREPSKHDGGKKPLQPAPDYTRSLLSQCAHRIYPRGTASGNVYGKQGHGRENTSCQKHRRYCSVVWRLNCWDPGAAWC